ncbi:alpha/beta hydrolase [Phytoactinopolyspora alkaliphila]|uniref:Alpha/beta hydrolase n=1 Tax=Phytoactinopolyspora alkaliphila TaxID=1783498 RepID=A0A6N9YKX4_9ACTN|nr:alpha/beta hydrolase [Phytoactinopolyspora alkaliphila]NED95696.1 alpha/beta hydrolase [Phytoactinopolyspora alkaliphila]
MNSRSSHAPLALGLLAVVALAACSSPANDPDEPPRQEMPPESTPAPDATEGVPAELAEFYTQTLQWEDCGDQYQCSSLTVPLNYEEPEGDTIDVALLRVPAASGEAGGSLVVNPGGPGASGMEYARNAHVVATEEVLEQFDIVGFDPRGVGASTPIDCVDDAELDEYLSGQASAETDEQLAELEATAEEFAQACDARSGDMLAHIGTADVARDMDVLRSALGDEKLNYLGKSYGTFIGAAYADLFPERAGRLVLDGAIDPALEADEVALGQARGFERALEAFLEWCLDNDCPLGESQEEARAALTDLLAEIDDEPLPSGDESRPLTTSLAFYGIILPLYSPANEGYPVLSAALELAVEDGDGSVLLQLADFYLARNPDGAYDGNQNEAIVAVNCVDRPAREIGEDTASVEDFEEASPVFGRFMAWAGLTCAAWPAASEFEPAQITGAGADPILVVGTTGDPATPYEWAEALAERLESGVLLTYDAFVHTAYLSGSDCVDDAVDSYLIGGTVPEEGLVCT